MTENELRDRVNRIIAAGNFSEDDAALLRFAIVQAVKLAREDREQAVPSTLAGSVLREGDGEVCPGSGSIVPHGSETALHVACPTCNFSAPARDGKFAEHPSANEQARQSIEDLQRDDVMIDGPEDWTEIAALIDAAAWSEDGTFKRRRLRTFCDGLLRERRLLRNASAANPLPASEYTDQATPSAAARIKSR